MSKHFHRKTTALITDFGAQIEEGLFRQHLEQKINFHFATCQKNDIERIFMGHYFSKWCKHWEIPTKKGIHLDRARMQNK